MITEESLKKSNALLLALHEGKTLLFDNNVYGEFTVHMNPQRNRYTITALDEEAKKKVAYLNFTTKENHYDGRIALLEWPIVLDIIMEGRGTIRNIGSGQVEDDEAVVQTGTYTRNEVTIVDKFEQAKLDKLIELRSEVSRLLKVVTAMIGENK